VGNVSEAGARPFPSARRWAHIERCESARFRARRAPVDPSKPIEPVNEVVTQAHETQPIDEQLEFHVVGSGAEPLLNMTDERPLPRSPGSPFSMIPGIH
jgi:hypothetical protein